MTVRLVLCVACFSAGAELARGFDPGDRVVTRDFAKLRSEGENVDELGPGQVLTVLAKRDGHLWVSRGKPGWIEINRVVALDRAEDALSNVFRTGASSLDYLARGNIRIATGRVEDGIADLRKAVRFATDRTSYLPALGFGLLAAMRQPEAITTFAEALKESPELASARMGRGLAYYRVGQLQAALEDFEVAIQLEPEHAFPRKYAGAALHDLGRLEEAGRMLRKAVALDSHDAFARKALGRLLYDLGGYDEAIEHFGVAVKLDPRDVEAVTGRGVVRHAAGQLNESLADYERAVAIADEVPGNAHLWSNLGQMQCELGDHQAGMRNLANAIKLDPQFAEPRSLWAYHAVSTANARTDVLENAKTQLIAVFAIQETKSFWDYRAVAAVNYALGNGIRAIEFQQKAINSVKSSGPPRYLAGMNEELHRYKAP